jgi:hypothetical protein
LLPFFCVVQNINQKQKMKKNLLALLVITLVWSSLLAQHKLEIDITTGSDNLEPKSTQHNVELRVILKDRPDVVKQNINDSKEWPNRSTRRIIINLPADVTEADIKELHLYRKRDGLQYVWQLGEKDNWNVDRVRVAAVLLKNGVSKRIPMLETGATRPRITGNNSLTKPLFRFVYEGGDNITEGQSFKLLLEPIGQGRMPAPSATKNTIIKVTLGTGGDDLRGGGDNVNLTVRFKSSTRVLTINNINQTKKLNNFTEETFSKEIPNTSDIDLNDIKEVELRHTGGGGIAADNWHVDKIYIVVNRDGINKVLVEKVGAPIHQFTGDARFKKFVVQ